MPPSRRREAARALRAESRSRGNGVLSRRLSGRAGKWRRLTDQRNRESRAPPPRLRLLPRKGDCGEFETFLFNPQNGFVQVFKAKLPQEQKAGVEHLFSSNIADIIGVIAGINVHLYSLYSVFLKTATTYFKSFRLIDEKRGSERISL